MASVTSKPVAAPSQSTTSWLSNLLQAVQQYFSQTSPLTFVVICAIALSLTGLWLFFQIGMTNIYADGMARLLITRRVIDSPTAGFGQLGSVWPPLTHVLSLPLIGNDFLYETGLALSIISMVAYVLTAYYLYLTVLYLTDDRLSGVVGALIFFLNPNMLFMQTTPMTEMPMYACMMAATYYMIRLAKQPYGRRWMLGSGIALSLGALVRYELWILSLIYIPMLVFIYWRHRMKLVEIEGSLIYWGFWAFAGAAVWMLWNLLLFGDPLTFQRGEYAKPALWVSENDEVFRNLPVAFMSYLYATLSTVGPLFFVGLVALLVYLWQTRLSAESLPPLALIALFPAFVVMLYLGQRPLQVPEISNNMYNIRFALVIALPTAIFLAYVTRKRLLAKVAVVALALASSIYLINTQNVITLRDPVSYTDEPFYFYSVDTTNYLLEHYDGRPIMMESYGNVPVQFEGRLPLGVVIYEGSYRIWEAAIADPTRYVDWVVMRYRAPEGGTDIVGDKLFQTIRLLDSFRNDFELVFQNEFYEIYRKRDSVPSAAALSGGS
jgi:hypothetical protein